MAELVAARTTAELQQLAVTGQLLAGGTDLLVQMQEGRKVSRLIDVSKLRDGPPVVRRGDGMVEISALAPLSAVARELDGILPGLDASIWVFGSVRIRNRATVGGNLGNASPAGDTIPPLVAAGAVAVLNSAQGRRRLPVAELVTGPRRTALHDGEWVESIEIPLPRGQEGFRKLGTREADAVTIVGMAWRWTIAPDGRLEDVRLALGSVAPTVIRATKAEAELEGRRAHPEVVDRAVAALRSEISPIDDYRASAQYRREVAGVLLREELARSTTPQRRAQVSA